MLRTTEDIWNEFSQRLRGFIANRITDPADAEDILQDVFVKLHTRIDTLRNEDRLTPWLYQIARNTIIDFYRAQPRAVPMPETLAIEDEPAESDAASRIASSLTSMLECLPDKYRQALVLSEFEGQTQQQVAEQLGLSLSGAKSRVQRGREMLREALLDCCHFEFDRLGHPIDYRRRPECCEQCAATSVS
ncbi:MAG TPA: RNA polymerase sigma factor SigZ [Anaerolineae bacterium]|nr:RNA polymerase sigma factor SigZ [Anaerolineae bacterium]